MQAHQAVMKDEVILHLNVKVDGIYIDATFGRGGHTQEILLRLGSAGKLLVIDKDPQALSCARELQQFDPRVQVFAGSFANMRSFAEQAGVIGQVNGILMDLGVSSPQLDVAERGFSFQHDGALDMRMDPTQGISAAQWLQHAEQIEIARVLKIYGEEKFSNRIAKTICNYRLQQPLISTKQLAELIKSCYPASILREMRKHPATKSFQAIRIFINNELAELRQALTAGMDLLAERGRLVVLSYHSLEDRIVKQFINTEAKGDVYPPDFPIRQAELQPRLSKIGKMLQPSVVEINANVRARSACLRVAERLYETC